MYVHYDHAFGLIDSNREIWNIKLTPKYRSKLAADIIRVE